MSLYRKKGSPFYWYDFTFQGKRYRDSTKERTRAAAGTVEAAALLALNNGATHTPRSARLPTLREFSVRFLAWSNNTTSLTPASQKFYTYGVRLLLFSRLADAPLDQLTSERVECTRFLRPVIDRRTSKPTGEVVPCSATYTNQALRTLKAMIGKAVDWKVLSTRTTFSTLKVEGRSRLIDPDTEIGLQRQFEAPTKNGSHNKARQRAWLVMVILQDTGMRPDELFAMQIEHIRWEASAIWIPRGKTPKATRWVGMSERMKSMLEEWCRGRQGWVFPSPRSASGHLESIAKGFQSARKRAGIDSRVVPYSARHTYGTYQMEATGNIFAVSRSMGHAGVESMKPYQHPDTTEMNAAINKRNRAGEMRRQELETEPSRHNLRHTTDLIQ